MLWFKKTWARHHLHRVPVTRWCTEESDRLVCPVHCTQIRNSQKRSSRLTKWHTVMSYVLVYCTFMDSKWNFWKRISVLVMSLQVSLRNFGEVNFMLSCWCGCYYHYLYSSSCEQALIVWELGSPHHYNDNETQERYRWNLNRNLNQDCTYIDLSGCVDLHRLNVCYDCGVCWL